MIKLLHQITVFHSVSSGEKGELKVDMIFFFPQAMLVLNI